MSIKTLRIVGFMEGISFLLLLFIAMPLKYIWDNPILVKYVGMGHGILFIVFLAVLFVVCEKQKWSINGLEELLFSRISVLLTKKRNIS